MDTVKTFGKGSNETKGTPETKGNNIRDDIKILWEMFFLETTLHGCHSIPKNQNFWLRRLLWLIFLAASTTILIVYIVEFYVSYTNHPFTTKNRLERVTSLPLPAISICDVKYQMSMVNNSDNLAEYLNVKMNAFIQAFGEFNMTEPSIEELNKLSFLPLEEFGMKKEDLILKAFVNGRNIDVKSEVESITSFFGQCFTYNMVGEDGSGGDITLSYGQNLQMILNISQEAYFPNQYGGMMLTFHDPRDLPTPSSIVVPVAPGFTNTIFLKATKLKFLPKPYMSYGDQFCVESTEFASKGIKGQKEYTWFSCVEECAVLNAVNLCNCTAKLKGFSESLSDRICTIEEIKGCIFPNILKVFFSFVFQNNTICDCPQPCETMQYDVRSSLMTFPSKPVADFLINRGAASSYQDLRDNYVSIDILFDRMVLYHEEHVPEITPGDIFAKLGGQMGLFLGASLLTLIELAETVLLSLLLLGKAVFGAFTGLKVTFKVTTSISCYPICGGGHSHFSGNYLFFIKEDLVIRTDTGVGNGIVGPNWELQKGSSSSNIGSIGRYKVDKIYKVNSCHLHP